jgi:hypothetical protein
MKNLSNKINKLSENLTRIGMEKGLRHPDVLELSQQLDKLIVKYYAENVASSR